MQYVRVIKPGKCTGRYMPQQTWYYSRRSGTLNLFNIVVLASSVT